MKVLKHIELMPVIGEIYVPHLPKLGVGSIVEYMGKVCTVQHRCQNYNGHGWMYTLLCDGCMTLQYQEWCD
jgi:hypothetical protein